MEFYDRRLWFWKRCRGKLRRLPDQRLVQIYLGKHYLMINVCIFLRQHHGALPAKRENPPIPFVSKSKKVEAEGLKVDKTDYIKFDLFADPENPTPLPKELLIFKDGFGSSG